MDLCTSDWKLPCRRVPITFLWASPCPLPAAPGGAAGVRRISVIDETAAGAAPAPAGYPEDEAHTDALEEVIIEKESKYPTGFPPDVDQCWEQFVTHCLPGVDKAVFGPERMERADPAQTKQSLEIPPKTCCSVQ